MASLLDDYLLELILMDSLVFTSARRIPDAERIIQSFIPPGLYDRIIARYDALAAEESDEDAYLQERWQRRAARKNSAWKRMMIERFLRIVEQNGCYCVQDLTEIARMARGMGAERECHQVFSCFAQPLSFHRSF